MLACLQARYLGHAGLEPGPASAHVLFLAFFRLCLGLGSRLHAHALLTTISRLMLPLCRHAKLQLPHLAMTEVILKSYDSRSTTFTAEPQLITQRKLPCVLTCSRCKRASRAAIFSFSCLSSSAGF